MFSCHAPSARFRAGTLSVLMFLHLAALLSGCGGSGDSEQITIRFARWGLPEELKAERELIREFEQANPDIKVRVEFNSWAEYWNKLQAQMAAGSAPDVFLIGGTYIHDYVVRDQIENLQPWMEKDSAAFDLGEYFEPTVKVFDFSSGLWALPRDCNTIGIYYNKTLFDKHGVPYPDDDWTWEDFIEKARALTVDENGDGRMESYGYLAAFESMEVHYISWIWQNGARVLNTDHNRSLLAEPEAVEAMRFFSDLVLKEKVSPDTAQASTFGSNMFLTGRLGMSSEGSWMVRLFSEIEGFDWDVAPLPKGKISAAPVNGLGNAIYSGSENKEAAWRLVRFLSSKTYQEQLAKSGTSIPALKEVAYSETYLDQHPANKEAFLRQIESHGRVLPFTEGFARYEDAIRGEMELLWLGSKGVEEAMTEAAARVDNVLRNRSVAQVP